MLSLFNLQLFTPSYVHRYVSGLVLKSVLSADINFVQREERSSTRATGKTRPRLDIVFTADDPGEPTLLTLIVALTLGKQLIFFTIDPGHTRI